MTGAQRIRRGNWSSEHFDAIAGYAQAQAREHFYAFRKYVHPDMHDAAWQKHACKYLQRFYDEYKRGLRPKLVLQAPPQHGKSTLITDFLAWMAGKEPDNVAYYTSYSDELGVIANLRMQRMLTSELYKKVFRNTRISDQNTVSVSTRFLRNASVLEYVGHTGAFRNTTVKGQINGMGFSLGVVDDPIKGRLEANSKTVREATWSWMTDDFFARFTDDAGMLMIMTRWHLDDPAGRWVDNFPETTVLRYAALIEDDTMADEDPLQRDVGEVLFPEHKSKPFILERKRILPKSSWESIWQQSPILSGGRLFPIEMFQLVNDVPRSEIAVTVRYWDKSGTDKERTTPGGSWTAGVLMHSLRDGRFCVENITRGQWSALDRERHIKRCAQIDEANYEGHHIYVEQEPGSGGKESAESTVRNLAGHNVAPDRPTGDKYFRAEPFGAQVAGGNVLLLNRQWTQDFVDECETYPAGRTKDQIDAAAGAFNMLCTSEAAYDPLGDWIDGPDPS